MTSQKQRPKVVMVKNGATPTRERQFQNGGVRVEAIAKGLHGKALVNRYRAIHECALDVYLERSIITHPEHRAGLRFREAYHRSVASRPAERRRHSLHSNNINHGGLTMSERLIRQANNELDYDTWNVVEDVCGHDSVIWSPRALDSLRKGLGHLAMKWHMSAIDICDNKAK